MHEVCRLYQSGRDLLEVLDELIAVDREPVGGARRGAGVLVGVGRHVPGGTLLYPPWVVVPGLTSQSLLVLTVVELVHLMQF